MLPDHIIHVLNEHNNVHHTPCNGLPGIIDHLPHSLPQRNIDFIVKVKAKINIHCSSLCFSLLHYATPHRSGVGSTPLMQEIESQLILFNLGFTFPGRFHIRSNSERVYCYVKSDFPEFGASLKYLLSWYQYLNESRENWTHCKQTLPDPNMLVRCNIVPHWGIW